MMKTSELTGAALDWAVAKCEGLKDENGWNAIDIFKGARTGGGFRYSTDWAHGGTIIENFSNCEDSFCLFFSPYDHVYYGKNRPWKAESYWGETPLIAAMRCYVAYKLGDTVKIPEELK